jgi:ERCC4-type nuclease
MLAEWRAAGNSMAVRRTKRGKQNMNRENQTLNQTDDFTIVADSREKAPYTFPGFPPHEIVRAAVPTGDYTILGIDQSVAIERKSLEDYLGSITHGRDRFFRELERLRKIYYRAIIVEASYADVLAAKWDRKVTAEQVIGTTMTIQCHYGIPVMWLGDRETAQRWLLDYFRRIARMCQVSYSPRETEAQP